VKSHINEMPNLTLSITEELHEKMKRHSEIRWGDIVRKSISEKIEDLEIMDRLAKKSKLTQADIGEISHKVNRDIFEELNKR